MPEWGSLGYGWRPRPGSRRDTTRPSLHPFPSPRVQGSAPGEPRRVEPGNLQKHPWVQGLGPHTPGPQPNSSLASPDSGDSGDLRVGLGAPGRHELAAAERPHAHGPFRRQPRPLTCALPTCHVLSTQPASTPTRSPPIAHALWPSPRIQPGAHVTRVPAKMLERDSEDPPTPCPLGTPGEGPQPRWPCLRPYLPGGRLGSYLSGALVAPGHFGEAGPALRSPARGGSGRAGLRFSPGLGDPGTQGRGRVPTCPPVAHACLSPPNLVPLRVLRLRRGSPSTLLGRPEPGASCPHPQATIVRALPPAQLCRAPSEPSVPSPGPVQAPPPLRALGPQLDPSYYQQVSAGSRGPPHPSPESSGARSLFTSSLNSRSRPALGLSPPVNTFGGMTEGRGRWRLPLSRRWGWPSGKQKGQGWGVRLDCREDILGWACAEVCS